MWFIQGYPTKKSDFRITNIQNLYWCSVGDAVFYQNECWTFTELVNFNELSNDPDSYQLVFPDTNCEDCTAQNICPTPTITNTITQTVSPTQTLTQTSTPSETPPIEIEYETVICNPCCGGGAAFINVEAGTGYGDIEVLRIQWTSSVWK